MRPHRLALALLLAWCGLGRAAAQSPPMDVPGPAEPAPPAPATTSSTTGVPAEMGPQVEPYLALFYDNAAYADTTVTATWAGILSPSATVSERVSFKSRSALALRFGVWGGPQLPWLGVAMDLGTLEADTIVDRPVHAAFHAVTLYVEPMLRLPLFRTGWAPDGVLDLHAGLALGGVIAGDASVTSDALGEKVSGDARGIGVGWLAGVSVRFWSVVLLAEARATSLNLEFDQLFQHGTATISSTQLLLGVGWRF